MSGSATVPAQTVDAGDAAGQRLDNFLMRRLKGVPRSRIYRMVRGGEVRVNGRRSRVGYRLARDDRVRIPPHVATPATAPPPGAPERVAARLVGAVIHDDDDVIVLNKPSGIAVHGGSGVASGVIETLRARRPGGWFELAHRIDRDTSGLLVVARNRRALLAWHEAFRSGRAHKRYDLVVEGAWPKSLRTVRERLIRQVMPNGERRMRTAREGGQSARTDFEVVRRHDSATHLAAFPRTGRTHQIRVHAAWAGHPVLGDDKYAAGAARNGRLLLHASRLRAVVDGRMVRFSAPLPAEIRDLPD